MGRVFAVSDLHGRGDVFANILDFLNPDDKVICLGDSADRGPDGIAILTHIIADPRFINLMGNHDDFIVQTMPYFWKTKGSLNMYGQQWVYNNGGEPTLDALLKYSAKDQMHLVAEISKFLPDAIYENKNGQFIILEHAGFSPCDIPHRSHDPLWDREHFHDNWGTMAFEEKDEEGNEFSIPAENVYLVHGHTPVQYLEFHYGYNGQDTSKRTAEELRIKHAFDKGDMTAYEPKIIRYCDGHKFDIDLGCVGSGVAALLDLDTFEVTYIKGDMIDENKNASGDNE